MHPRISHTEGRVAGTTAHTPAGLGSWCGWRATHMNLSTSGRAKSSTPMTTSEIWSELQFAATQKPTRKLATDRLLKPTAAVQYLGTRRRGGMAAAAA